MSLSPAAREHLLALADDEHMVGARHTNWIGLGPFLEEDLAFCSIAQDELGHAIALYRLILDDERPAADGTTATGERDAEADLRDQLALDAFAMMREPGDYRSCWLAEIECSEWNDSLVRHWLYDRAEELRWEALVGSGDERVAAVARRALSEERFHLTHADQFLSRIADSDTTGRIAASVERLAPIAAGVFDAADTESDAVAEGLVTTSSAELAGVWADRVRSDLARWGLSVDVDLDPAAQSARQAGRTVRSDGFDDLLADLQKVICEDPAAVW